MKKFLLGGAAILALGGAAVAADLPIIRKAEPYVGVPGFNWSGIYIGGEAGYGFSAIQLGEVGTSLNTITDPGSIGTNASGGVGGLTAAFRYQPIGSGWVFGIKAAADLTGISARTQPDTATQLATLVTTGITAPTSNASIPWDGRVGLELGYSIMPNFMIYADGGAAFGEIKMNATAMNIAAVSVTNPTGFVQQNIDNVHVGWWAGLGAKYAVLPNLIFGVDWVYADLGTHGITFVGPLVAPGVATTFNVNDHAAYNKIMGTLEVKF